MTTAQQVPSRVIKFAAILFDKFGNPDVAAFNRSRKAKSERAKDFWFSVGRALWKPYACQSWTNYDMEMWDRIYAARSAKKRAA